MSIKLTSAETGRNKSAISAAVGTGNKITIAPFTTTNIKNVPGNWSGEDIGYVDTTNSSTIAAAVQINNIYVTDSNWNILDDTAVSTTGGYLKLIGVGFQTGAVVYIQGTPATSTVVVGTTELRVTTASLSSGTLQVYVVNPDNSVAIRLSTLVASGVPNWSTTSPLTSQFVDVPIYIQLIATSDSTIAYSLDPGSSLPSGVSLSSGGLLSGTIIGLTSETTYNFTIVATDLELQDTAKVFSVTITLGDSLFNVTSFLLNATDKITWIADASGNNNNNTAITVVGDTKPSAFSPYNTSWSGYFDGTGDYISMPNNSAFDQTGAWTIELWLYPTATSSSYIYSQVTSNFLQIATNATNFLQIDRSGVGVIITSASALNLNSWTHVAVVSSGTTIKLYINGLQSGSTSTYTPTAVSGTTTTIGAYQSGGTLGFTGYISNFRLVKGTEVYTANTTPPTAPLTAIANTQLLTVQSNRFIDNSNNAFTITKSGDTSIKSFDPFTEQDLLSGSGYFDGTGDYISTPSSQLFTFGTGDFTIEGWMYLTATATATLFDNRTGASSLHPIIYYNGTNLALYVAGSNAITGPALTTGRWYHIAVSRRSASTKMFVDGLQVGSTYADTNNYATSGTVNVGAGLSVANPTTGYISNLRVVKGTGLYTANTSPPTVPLTSVANTVLLTLQSRQGENNNRILDTSGQKNIVTRVGNPNQGTFTPYSPAGWSATFDNTGDYIQVPSSASFGFGTGDFTWECWAYFNATGDNRLLDFGNNNLLYMGSTTLVYYTGAARITSSTISAGQWYHVAIVRSGGITKMYINGVQNGIDYTDTMNYATSTLRIGTDSTATQFMYGFISNVRIVKGLAVYTGNFTAPVAKLNSSQSASTNIAAVTIADTSLLTLQDNRFVDNSNNALSVTPVADAKIVAFSPFRPTATYNVSTSSGSSYFDAAGDYLTIPADPSFTFGTSDFTVEFWVYFNDATSEQHLYDGRGTTTGLGVSLWMSSGSIKFNTAATTRITSSTIYAGTWYHVALARSSGTTKLFINGLQSGVSYTDSNSYVQANLAIANRCDLGTTLLLNGYLSNLRVTKGSAEYTANTTPPTTAVATTANTGLKLDFTNSGILDYSGKFNIETAGNSAVSLSSFSPYSNYWSAFFDGNGDYLTIPTNAAFALGTNDYTIEAWIYLTSMPAAATGTIIQKYNVTNGRSFTLQAGGGAVTFFVGTTAVATTSASTITTHQWYHVAVVRNGATITIYVNGTSQASGAAITVPTSTTSVAIGFSLDGAPSTYYFPGYISNLRLVNGTAVYTANTSPPTSPLTVVTNTQLLTLQNNSLKDNSNNAFTLTRNGEVKVNDFAPFEDPTVYNKSLQFRVKTDQLSIYANPRITVLGGDFTLESWIYPIDYSTVSVWGLIDTRQSGATAAAFSFGVSALASPVSGYYRMYYYNAGYSYGTTSIVGGTWTHVAWERVGSTLTFYVNGVAGGTATVSGTITAAATTNPIWIGHKDNSLATYGTNGYINDFRLTNGTARYNGNFTPPNSPFLIR